MKIKHIWSVLCKESIINQDDNLITLNSVLEELNIELGSVDQAKEFKLPEKFSLPINTEIVSLWLKDETVEKQIEGEIEYILVDPNGNKIGLSKTPFLFPLDKKRFRTRLKIHGLGFTVPGRYLFKISYKEKDTKHFVSIIEIPLDVTIKIKQLTTSNP